MPPRFKPNRPLALLLIWTGLLLAAGGAVAAPAFRMFPSSNLYPGYVADPRRPQFSVALLTFPDPQVESSGDRRVGLKLGGRFGLVRLHSSENPERGVQLDIEAGFTGQFDIEHSLDNLGWDGTYGFLFSSTLGNGASVQLGPKHISSHVGDEYAERIGRRRIGLAYHDGIVPIGELFREDETYVALGVWLDP